MQGGKWPVHKTISSWVIMLALKINPSTPLQSANRSSLNFDAPKEGIVLKIKDLNIQGQGGALREVCGWVLGCTHLSLLDARIDGVQEVCPVLVTLR